MRISEMKFNFTVPFLCDDAIRHHLQTVFSGEYDLRVNFAGGRRILDLGANYGSFSVWATHRWPGSTITAYEPNPKTFESLQKNIAGYPNITAHNFGVGTPGYRILSDGAYNVGECSFHTIMNNPCPTGQHLEVHDPLELPEADIIKLDIEGCEMEVLEPLVKAGRTFELIMLEWHNESLRRAIDQLLTDYALVGSEVQHICGRGISKYLRKDLL